VAYICQPVAEVENGKFVAWHFTRNKSGWLDSCSRCHVWDGSASSYYSISNVLL